jgi:hypothetical protein
MKFNTNSFAVPTLAEASADYADQLKRQHDMRTKLSAAERESAALHAKLDGTAITSADSAKAERVAALLDDPSDSKQLNAGLDRARLRKLDQTIGDLKGVLVELSKRVTAARAAASKIVCERVAPEHQRRVGAVCGKLVELHAAVAEYATFADSLNDNDIVWQNLIPAHPTFLGRPNDRYGAIADYLREAVRDGNFSPKEIPASLRHV